MNKNNDSWTELFKEVIFHSNTITNEIFTSLTNGLPLEVYKSNKRSKSTVPTWHVFYSGVRILAVDINQYSLLCRFLKMDYMPKSIHRLYGLRPEKWNKSGVHNITFEDSFDAEQVSNILKEHIKIIKEVLLNINTELPKPQLDKNRLKEQYFEDEVIANLNSIAPELELVRRQAVIPFGRIDILCKNRNNNPVVLELKIGNGKVEVIDQINNYLNYFSSKIKIESFGVIIIQESNVQLSELCIENNLKLVVWNKNK